MTIQKSRRNRSQSKILIPHYIRVEYYCSGILLSMKNGEDLDGLRDLNVNLGKGPIMMDFFINVSLLSVLRHASIQGFTYGQKRKNPFSATCLKS